MEHLFAWMASFLFECLCVRWLVRHARKGLRGRCMWSCKFKSAAGDREISFGFLSLIMQVPAVAGHDFTDVQIFSRSLAIEAAEHTFATALNFAVFGGECIALYRFTSRPHFFIQKSLLLCSSIRYTAKTCLGSVASRLKSTACGPSCTSTYSSGFCWHPLWQCPARLFANCCIRDRCDQYKLSCQLYWPSGSAERAHGLSYDVA